MKMTNTKSYQILILTSALTLAPLFGDTTHQVVVSGQANIYGSGKSILPAPGGGSAGVAPVLINLGSAGPGRTMQIVSATGMVDCCTAPNGADGSTVHLATRVSPFGGLSGITHPVLRNFLTGVFLDDSVPADPPPATLDFAADFNSLSPALRQVFFIGDGRNQTGQVQTFQVPTQATRLFLGFADFSYTYGILGPDGNYLPGAYENNTGALMVGLNVDISYALPTSATDVVVGAANVYVLSGNQVLTLDRHTLAPARPAITVAVPGLSSVDSIGLWRGMDNRVFVGGTVTGTSGDNLMFIRQYIDGVASWTYIGSTPVAPGTVSIAEWAGAGQDCVYSSATTTHYVNGVRTMEALIVKLRWGVGLHWEQFIALPASRVYNVSVHPSFSNVQAVGSARFDGQFRGFFQVFAESGGTPGPRDVWPENNSIIRDVAAAGPGKGVYAVGAVLGLGGVPSSDNDEAKQILRRYSFDGTRLWTMEFTEPNATQQGIKGVSADSSGVWMAGNLTVGPYPLVSKLTLRYIGFNQEQLMKRYVEAPAYYVQDVGSRDGSAYLVGGSPIPPYGGFVFKVTRR